MLGFADARFAAEVEEATEIWASDRGAEFTLQDVYLRLARSHPAIARTVPVATLAELELRAERLACRRHPRHGDLFDAALAAGKRVVVASDTYLPEAHLEAVLTDAGYHGWERLFASNAVGTNKASGRLFHALVETLGVSGDRIAHFGDDVTSDVLRAEASGLHRVLVQRGDTLLARRAPHLVELGRHGGTDRLASSIFLGVQYADASRDPFEDPDSDTLEVAYHLGHRILGPVGYAFTCWVADQAKLHGLDKLCFVSREGWFLRRLYDTLAPRLGCEVPSEYLYASRRMLRMTIATEPLVDFVLDVLADEGPIQAYLDNVELDLSDEELQHFGFHDRGAFVRGKDLADLLRAHRNRLASIRDDERAACLAYLQETGFVDAAHVGLVDSGWFGNSQRALTQLLRGAGHDVQLTGLYVGLAPSGRRNFSEDSSALGFLYHFRHPAGARDVRPFNDLARMIELLLAAPSPSVRRMRRTPDGVVPVFVRKPTNERLHPVAEAIQRGALAFAETYADALPGEPPRLTADLGRSLLEGFLREPSYAEARCVGQLPYDKSEFNDETSIFLTPPDEATRAFLSNPRRIQQEFADSNWRQGYLASLRSEPVRRLLLASHPSLWQPAGLPARTYDRLRRWYRRVRAPGA